MLGSNASNTSRIQLKIFQTPRGAAAFLYDNIKGYGQLSGNIRVGRRYLQVQNCGEKCHVLGRVHTNAPRLFSGGRGEWSEVKCKLFGLFYSSINPGATVTLQGISIRLFPGCMKLGEKVAFCLPSAGKKMQCFHHIFSQPGKSLLDIPCRLSEPPMLALNPPNLANNN